MSLATKMRLALAATCAFFLPLSAPSADVLAVTNTGFTGIDLIKKGEFPVIAFVRSNSPAARDGRLHQGDEIVSVSPDGTLQGFIPTKGMSLAEVVSLLRGPPNSSVALEARLARETPTTTQTIIRLERAELVTFPLLNGTVAQGFIGTNLAWGRFGLTHDNIKKLRHIPSSKWSQVRIGMAVADVVPTVGEPLQIKRLDAQESVWTYGWLVRLENTTLDPGTVELRITNGFVSHSFGIAEPLGQNIKFELLSK